MSEMPYIQIIQAASLSSYTAEFILVGLALILLMADALLKNMPKYALGIVGGFGALLALPYCSASGLIYSGIEVGKWLSILAVLATALTILMSVDYRAITNASSNDDKTQEGTGEFYILPLIACAGITGMCKASNLVSLFVSLEVLTLASYIMVGYYRRNHGSLEASVKYLILGATSTGITVFGLAWFFGMTGSFDLSAEVWMAPFAAQMSTGMYFAVALILLGAAFKIGAFPMQMWIPDVYQGAPTPTTAFLSVASKIGGFVFLAVFLAPLYMLESRVFLPVFTALSVMAAATLIIGNLGAIGQTNMKRLLGYSSIAQAGFILPLFLLPHGESVYMVSFYLLAYLMMTFGAFFALCLIRTQRGSEQISAFRGLGETNPRLALAITIMFASLAGVPLTGGFIAKLLPFFIVVQTSAVYWLIPIMVIGAATGFYYYFKVIRAMYWDKPAEGDQPIRIPVISGVVLALFSVLLIITGVLPLLWV